MFLEKLHPSRVFLACCLAFLTGVLFVSLVSVPATFSFLVALFGAAVIVAAASGSSAASNNQVRLGSRRLFLAGGATLLFFAGGLLRVQLPSLVASDAALSVHAFNGSAPAVRGVVAEDPDVRVDGTRFVIDAREVVNSKKVQVEGRVLVFTDRWPQYRYGDSMILEGELEAPKALADFDWPAFLAKDNIYSIMYWPRVSIEGRGHGNALLAFLYDLKAGLQESVYRALPAKNAAVLQAILTGDEGGMSDGVKTSLNRSGLRHIVAVSGMNITLVAAITMGFFLGVGLWRQHAFLLALVMVVLFVLFVGAPPSAVRAGIMGALMLFAQRAGRLSSAHTAVAGAAALMVFVDPKLLRWDIGFQLSFLAVLGIVLLSEHFSERLSFVPRLFDLRNILAMTLAAQLFTIPFLLFVFSQLSLVSVLANVLVVPLLPFLTVSGFAFGFTGIAVPQLGQVFGVALLPFTSWILHVAELFGKLPVLAAALPSSFAPFSAAAYYGLLYMWWLRLRRAKRWPAQQLALRTNGVSDDA